jgi:Relaxase/Mobilisation nuclease domain
MIPKGNQRGGGQQLATHLLNSYDNEDVVVEDVRGAVASDLHGAFAEWYAQAKGTQCVKYLYSLSINPDHTQGPFNRDHYYDFIRRTESILGLGEQPRAVVFHVKHGREHCHVIWSRIDTDKMKAVQLSHDRQKLRAVAQEYAKDHNLRLPPGMQNDRGKDRFPDHAKNENLAEKQQEERTGTPKEQRMEQITKLWQNTSDGPSFIKALETNGYFLARGDQVAYVVVDLYGEIHSLARQIDGANTKELKLRLADYPLEKLMDAAAAQARARDERQALLLRLTKQQGAANDPAATPATARERREALQKSQAVRRENLDAKRQQLAERHGEERKALAELQSARSEVIVRARAAQQSKGVLAFLARITGFNALTAFRHERQDKQRYAENRQQTAALLRRHRREMQNFRQQGSSLTSLDKRERRSLETGLRREVLRQLIREGRPTMQPEFTVAAAGIARLRKSEDERKGKLKKDFAAAAKNQKAAEARGDTEGSKTAAFNRAARPSPAPTKGDLQRAFEQAKSAVRKTDAGQPEHTEQIDPEKLERAREKKDELQSRKPPPPGPDRDREK